MSPAIATACAIALYVALLAPLAWAWRKGGWVTPVAYVALLAALGVYQTGVFQRSALTATDGLAPSAAPREDGKCRQLLEATKVAGFGVDASDPAAPKITGRGADQLPPAVRDAVLECHERLTGRAAANESKPLEDAVS